MSKVQVRSRRGFVDLTIRVIADLAMVNAALMGGLLLNEAWFERVPLRVHASDFFGFFSLSVVFLGVSRLSGLQQIRMTERRALATTPYVLVTFLVFAVLNAALPHLLGFSGSTLAMAAGLGVLFIVGARVRPKGSVKAASETDAYLGNPARAQNVLLIGGAGHIGSVLVPKLLEDGYRVRVLDKLVFGDGGLSGVRGHRNLEVLTGDFRDLNTVVHAMSGMDTIVHLGPVLSDPGYEGNDELILETNRIATRLVGSCAKAVNARRFIFASSCSVYGTASHAMNEASDLKPSSLYGRAKVEAEAELSQMASKKFRPIILRIGTTYGVGGRSRFNSIVSYLASVSDSPSELTLSAPDRAHPFVHVEDLARAIELTLEAPAGDVCGQVYNVGSECQNLSLVEAAEIIRRQTEFGQLTITKSTAARDGHRIEFSKIQTHLGFKPHWTLEAGVRQVVEASQTKRVEAAVLTPTPEHHLTEEIELTFVGDSVSGSTSGSVGKGLVI